VTLNLFSQMQPWIYCRSRILSRHQRVRWSTVSSECWMH